MSKPDCTSDKGSQPLPLNPYAVVAHTLRFYMKSRPISVFSRGFSSSSTRRVLSSTFLPTWHKNAPIDVHPEVSEALASSQAVVALESTIITHGMPFPQNLETARSVERVVRCVSSSFHFEI